MKLLNNDGSYNFTEFVGKNGTWKLIGSKSQINHTDPLLCKDTFVNKKGEYIEVKRDTVKEMADDGKIKPVEESKIIAKTYSKKEWDKKTNGVDR